MEAVEKYVFIIITALALFLIILLIQGGILNALKVQPVIVSS